MPLSKADQVERLFRALAVREGELKASDEAIRKATVRSESLSVAIADLRKTIKELIDNDEVPEEVLARAPPEIQRLIAGPMLGPAEGTLLTRALAYIDNKPAMVEASEITQALGISIDTARTVLSKLRARGLIHRFEPGQYCSLKHANDMRGEPETR